jgi:hypothetical protein
MHTGEDVKNTTHNIPIKDLARKQTPKKLQVPGAQLLTLSVT